MNEIDWRKVKVPESIRSIVRKYSKIKKAFQNTSTISKNSNNPIVFIGIEEIYEELLSLKKRLKEYQKTSGLDKI